MVVFNHGIINNGDFPLPGSTTKGNRRRGWIRTTPTQHMMYLHSQPLIVIISYYILPLKHLTHYNMIISYINHYYTVSHSDNHYDICITYFPIFWERLLCIYCVDTSLCLSCWTLMEFYLQIIQNNRKSPNIGMMGEMSRNMSDPSPHM